MFWASVENEHCSWGTQWLHLELGCPMWTGLCWISRAKGSDRPPAVDRRMARHIWNRGQENRRRLTMQAAQSHPGTPAALSQLTCGHMAGLAWLDEERGKSPSLVSECISVACVWKLEMAGRCIMAVWKEGFEHSREGKSSLRAEPWAAHSTVYGMRSRPKWEHIQIPEPWPMAWPAHHGPWKKINRWSETRKSGVGAGRGTWG